MVKWFVKSTLGINKKNSEDILRDMEHLASPVVFGFFKTVYIDDQIELTGRN